MYQVEDTFRRMVDIIQEVRLRLHSSAFFLTVHVVTNRLGVRPVYQPRTVLQLR